jgi:Tfp pilus assembly protein PilV
MFKTICNKKGISIVEAIVAVFITSVAIVSIAAMQPVALRTGASADYLGRAVAIAQAEAARREAVIMTTGAVIPADSNNAPLTVQNVTYLITTVTTPQVGATGQQFWLLSVHVMWPGTVNGVTHNRVITQQMGY